MLSEDALFACRVLSGMSLNRRTYPALLNALQGRLRRKYPDLLPPNARARAVRAIMEAMDDGAMVQVGGRLLSKVQLEEEMGGG